MSDHRSDPQPARRLVRRRQALPEDDPRCRVERLVAPAAEAEPAGAEGNEAEFLRRLLDQLLADIDNARRLSRTNALPRLYKQVAELRTALAAAEAQVGPGADYERWLDELSDEEWRTHLAEEAMEMPDRDLEVLVRQYCERHGFGLWDPRQERVGWMPGGAEPV